jgi:uncharacterized protein
MDSRLLEILVCPVSKVALVTLSSAQLAALNTHIQAGSAQTVDGESLRGVIRAGLISTDGKVIYRIEDAIPVLLPEEGIGTTQFLDFPRG